MKTSAKQEVTILIAEDDDGHAELIRDNLLEAGVGNPMTRFRNGQEVLDFFFDPQDAATPCWQPGQAYLLLLDIRMPKVDGVAVLKKIKSDPRLKGIPIIILTTTDDPRDINICYDLGCSCYITKPVDYRKFAEILNRLGLFLLVMQIPDLT